MKPNRILIFLLPFALCRPAVAQERKDTTLRTNTIEVIQSYRPEVKQAPKPEYAPSLPPVDTSRPRLKYDVPEQTIYFSYHSQPLRPLALGRDTAALPFPSYLKLGGGNLSTLLLDAGIGGLKGENYASALRLHHLSQNGDIKNQHTVLTGLEADGALGTDKNVWNAHLGINRRQFGFYGYDHKLFDPAKDSVKQVFTDVDVAAGLSDKDIRYSKLSVQPRIAYSFYKDRFEHAENSFAFSVPFSSAVDSSFSYYVALQGNYTAFQSDISSDDIFLLQLAPGLKYRKGVFEGRAGLTPSVILDDQSYLLPDITVSVHVPNSQFRLSLGWQEYLDINSYKRLTMRNPWYLASAGGFAESATRRRKVFGGIQSNLGNHLSFAGRFTWHEWRNLPLFINDSTDTKYFSYVFDPLVRAFSIQADVRYQVSNTFAAGLSGTWINYYERTQRRVWHEPGIQIKGDLLFRPVPELTVTAYSLLLDRIYAMGSAGQTVKMDAVLDIGAGAEYNFIPRLSAFLNANNLLNNEYERWYGYPSYGFNIYVGLRLKF